MNEHILILDDEENLIFFLKSSLEEIGYSIHTASTIKEGLILVDKVLPDLLLLDLNLPDGNGLELYKNIRAKGHNIPTIVISAHASVKSAIEALKLGVDDFIIKPFDLDELKIVIEKQFSNIKFTNRLRYYKNKESQIYKGDFFISKLKSMESIQNLCLKLAQIPETVILIEGPSGSGKEMLARFIHENSDNEDAPFIEINCASLSENLIESELFGHEAGAYTDAKNKKIGLIELAQGGTLFLDEIAEMDLSLQAKLLRVIETKIFKRLGGVRDIHVSLRIIAATNKNVESLVNEGNFREDLFYRLNKFNIKLPPLRERREELLQISRFLLKKISENLNIGFKEFNKEAELFILNYDWPGNFRELHNAIERAVILSEGNIIGIDQLPRKRKTELNFEPILDLLKNNSLREFLDEIEKSLLLQALELNQQNQIKTAETLKEPRHIIRYLLKKHNLSDGENG